MCTCMRVDVCSGGEGSMVHVPLYQFLAMSLKRAVKSLQQIPYIHLCQSTRRTLGVYTGGNTIYLMLHCPHVQSPPPHAGDSQCLTSISYSEQAGRQAGEWREWTPSCCKSAFKHPAKCNLERVNKRPLTLRCSRYLFLFILECAIDFLLLPSNDVCKR